MTLEKFEFNFELQFDVNDLQPAAPKTICKRVSVLYACGKARFIAFVLLQ